MFSLFAIFLVELIAFRVGTARLEKARAAAYDSHGHGVGGAGAAHGPEPSTPREPPAGTLTLPAVSSRSVATSATEKHHGHGHEVESGDQLHTMSDSTFTQLIGVAILEFGVMFHSVLIGLTLAVDQEFKLLFAVVTVHQLFEGLGLGARLSALVLPRGYHWVPIVGAILFGVTTPIGIAAGLGARSTYAPESSTALIVSGIFDALSAGILLYTGVAELLAHEFLFNPHLARMSNRRLTFACVSMLFGAGLMALLGRWA